MHYRAVVRPYDRRYGYTPRSSFYYQIRAAKRNTVHTKRAIDLAPICLLFFEANKEAITCHDLEAASGARRHNSSDKCSMLKCCFISMQNLVPPYLLDASSRDHVALLRSRMTRHTVQLDGTFTTLLRIANSSRTRPRCCPLPQLVTTLTGQWS